MRSTPERRPARAKLLLALVATLVATPVGAKPPRKLRSPVNGADLDLGRAPARYEFLLVGHLYGSQNKSIYPAASVIANLDVFNRDEVRFIILLGDMLKHSDPVMFAAFDSSFARHVRKPLFNAIGNHDDDSRGVYRRRVGAQSYYSFRYASELFVVLDSELDDGKICDEQLEFVRQEVRRADTDPGIRNLFVFSHRLLWAIDNPPLNAILPYVNGPENHPPDATAFVREILPDLRTLGKHVYLVSGDVGGTWSFPIFYQEDPYAAVTYIATGIGDSIDDTVLLATVERGKVRIEPVSLTGFGSIEMPLTDFDVLYWLREFADRSN